MPGKYLHRDDAPFGERVWESIDATVVAAATSQLSARRLLRVEGPFGLGLKTLPGSDAELERDEGSEAGVEGVAVSTSPVVPVASVRAEFEISIRDIAAFEERGMPLDLSHAIKAAVRCARQEDDLLFNGMPELGVPGLLTVAGASASKLTSWAEAGKAADNIIQALTELDGQGFHGPYALALSPDRFNLLYRRYAQSAMTELDHIKEMATGGVIKAPAIQSGGALVATGAPFATIALGQDMMTGFIGPGGGAYEFVISETLALRIRQPAAVCVLK